MEDVLHWEGPAQFLSRRGSSQRVLCCCPLREVDLAAVVSVQKSGVQNWDTSPHSLRPTWICGPRTWRSRTDWDRTWKNHFKVTTDQRVCLINFLLLKDLFFRKLVLEWIIEMTDVLSRFFRSFLYNFHVFRPENQRLDILTRTCSIEDTSLYRLEQTDLIPCWDWVETVGETEDTIPVCDKVWTGDGPASV